MTTEVKDTCEIGARTLLDFAADYAAIEEVSKDTSMELSLKNAVVKQYVDRNHERLASLHLHLHRCQEALVTLAQKSTQS